MLIGLCGAELVPKSAVGAATVRAALKLDACSRSFAGCALPPPPCWRCHCSCRSSLALALDRRRPPLMKGSTPYWSPSKVCLPVPSRSLLLRPPYPRPPPYFRLPLSGRAWSGCLPRCSQRGHPTRLRAPACRLGRVLLRHVCGLRGGAAAADAPR